MQTSIAENIQSVWNKIDAACKRAGRDASEVTLIAVTKTVSAQTAQLAIDAGICDIGENRVQEYQNKVNHIDSQINVHFIGQLQRNKVKYIVSDVACIHSVDRLSLAQEIQRRAQGVGRCIDVLIQVGFDDDENRGGVKEAELFDLACQIEKMENLHLCGLMCVAPVNADEGQTRACFRQLRILRDKLSAQLGRTLPHLSMGMSCDYELAVEEGATFVRVGTTIFGARNYEVRA
ncbi:MAG: YggS family pyridoxal phosphate-dependent enzyme [Clostridia bacterium]|nr:YggS family pyridoxal phosphate-dependent enzyme [Clostridia bacterium]